MECLKEEIKEEAKRKNGHRGKGEGRNLGSKRNKGV
jgi:hypothetical protein